MSGQLVGAAFEQPDLFVILDQGGTYFALMVTLDQSHVGSRSMEGRSRMTGPWAGSSAVAVANTAQHGVAILLDEALVYRVNSVLEWRRIDLGLDGHALAAQKLHALVLQPRDLGTGRLGTGTGGFHKPLALLITEPVVQHRRAENHRRRVNVPGRCQLVLHSA